METTSSVHRRLFRFLLLALAATPAIVPLAMIFAYGVDIPYWDQWEIDRELAVKAHEHGLTWSDIYRRHNEHRLVLPRLAALAAGWLTRGSEIAEMLGLWVTVCLTSAGVLQLCSRTAGLTTPVPTPPIHADTPGGSLFFLSAPVLTRFFLCNLMLFSPAQWETFISGGCWGFVMSAMWLVGACLIVSSSLSRWLKTGLAIPLAVAATFTMGNGVLCFPLVATMVAWSMSWDEFRAKRGVLVVWAFAFIITCVVHGAGHRTAQPIAEEGEPVSVLRLIHFMCAFLGNSFDCGGLSHRLTGATIVGAMLFVLLISATGYFLHAWLVRRDRNLSMALLPWLALAGFGFLSGAIAAIFRVQLGVDYALTSRYVTLSLWVPVALINLVPIICEDLRRTWGRVAADRLTGFSSDSLPGRLCVQTPAFLAAALLTLHLTTLPNLLDTCDLLRLTRLQAKAAVLLIGAVPDNPQIAKYVNPHPAKIAALVPKLSALGYIHPPIVASSNAALLRAPDSERDDALIHGQLERYRQDGSDLITVEGWALVPEKVRQADAVFLTYDNEQSEPIIFVVADVGMARPDVVRIMRQSGYLRSGWIATFPLKKLPPQTTPARISAWALDTATGLAYRLDGEAMISLPGE